MNKIQVVQRNRKVIMLQQIFFKTSCSMGHCVSSDILMRARIAEGVDQFYLQMKNESSKELTRGTVFAFHDQYLK